MKVSFEFDGDELLNVFSGCGVGASREEFVRANLICMLKAISEIAATREYLAMTGAMRWPESQEAVIESIAGWRML